MNELQESIRYLELRLAECHKRPELNRNQIEAYDFFLQMARTASSGEDYIAKIRSSGNMYQLGRGEALDRYGNMLRIHQTMQDDRKVRSDFVNLNAARDSTSHQDMHARQTPAAEEGATLTKAAFLSCGQVRSLFVALIDWKLQKKPTLIESKMQMLQHEWSLLEQGDPDCTWDKLCSFPPYRQRIPFDDARLAQLGEYFKEAFA